MIWYLLLAAMVGLSLAVAVSRPRSGSSLTWLGGMLIFYVGQRLLEGEDTAVFFNGAGLVVIIAAFVTRLRAMTGASASQTQTQRAALIAQVVATSSLLLYALTTDATTDAMGLDGAALDRWYVSWAALWPIVWLAGALSMLFLDLVLSDHPVLVPPGARRHAVQTGLSLAFGLSLVFPLNYLADAYDVDADYSYFRVTRPGSSTEALVRNLEEPVEVLLFYAPGNDVKEKLLPYFTELADASGGKLTVKVVDQAMAPELAKELAVRDNGNIVLRQGESKQKFKIDEDLDRAKRDLKRLDGTFQKHLLKLAQGKRTAYVLTGHGEANARLTNPFYKLGEFKKILREQNYEVNDFGIEDGSTSAVPDDAALVVIPAPEKPLLPEEIEVLKRYVDGGGALLVYGDPGRERLSELLGHVGVALGEHPLAHATRYAVATRGPIDRLNLVSNRFGSHATVSTLSKYSTKAAVVFLSTGAVTETGQGAAPGPAKYTPLIRSFEDTWEDADGDLQKGPGEEGGTHVLAMAVEGPESAPYRVVVLGDVAVAGDFLLQRFAGNAQLVLDSTRWLVGDEELTGDVSNEEDVRIEHTREEDQVWFYGTIFGVPLLVLVAGVVLVSRRGRAGR